MDGANRPREAWQALLRIAGLPVAPTHQPVTATVAVRGHVLRGVSLDIEQGTVVCLAGSVDSASALLQILGTALVPTTGSVEIYAPVTAMLTTTGGLDLRATAVENIRDSKGFLAATPAEAEVYAAEVIEFAGLQGFEHVPLRTYSTGMMLRLGVALALCGHPSIVLIDDVLTVADIGFQQKCIDRVRQLRERGCTVLLNLSDDTLIQQVATRVVTFDDGRVVGDTAPADARRLLVRSGVADTEWRILQNLPADEVMAVRSLSLDAVRDDGTSYLDLTLMLEPKTIELRCRPSIFLTRGRTVIFRSLYPRSLMLDSRSVRRFTVRVPTDTLPSGDYAIGLSIMTEQGRKTFSLKALNAVALSIRRAGEQDTVAASVPLLAMPMPWEIEALAENAS
jgi:ABC-type polysaccharide/polyol phosphate transport system ATPase subunit